MKNESKIAIVTGGAGGLAAQSFWNWRRKAFFLLFTM